MSKSVDQLKPNLAPVYAAALYPGLCEIFHRHGYALAVHGSLARDFDLVAIPWADSVSAPERVLLEVEATFFVRRIGEPGVKRHGRIAFTCSVGFAECALDLSFFPGPDRRSLELEREMALIRENLEREVESDSIVASCNCHTKTPESSAHKPGCKYRLIVERESLKAELANTKRAS